MPGEMALSCCSLVILLGFWLSVFKSATATSSTFEIYGLHVDVTFNILVRMSQGLRLLFPHWLRGVLLFERHTHF